MTYCISDPAAPCVEKEKWICAWLGAVPALRRVQPSPILLAASPSGTLTGVLSIEDNLADWAMLLIAFRA